MQVQQHPPPLLLQVYPLPPEQFLLLRFRDQHLLQVPDCLPCLMRHRNPMGRCRPRAQVQDLLRSRVLLHHWKLQSYPQDLPSEALLREPDHPLETEDPSPPLKLRKEHPEDQDFLPLEDHPLREAACRQ